MALSVAELNAINGKLEKAADYLCWIRSLAATGGDGPQAREVFAQARPKSAHLMAKAAVVEGRVDGGSWGDQLAQLHPAPDAFIELTRARSAIGRMTGFKKVPFGIKVPRQTSGALVQWTDEGEPTVVGRLSFDSVMLEHSKTSGIVVVSTELAKLANPDAQQLINNDLIKTTAMAVDRNFLDPNLAATGDSPAAITWGVSPIMATGTTADALRGDLKALIADMVDRGSDLESLYLVMSKVMATSIGLMGETWTNSIGPNGGTLLNIQVLTTIADQGEGGSPASERITAIDADKILLADGGVEISASEASTLEMSTTPDETSTASTAMVSLWQNNLIALKITRAIRWEPAGGGASGWITGAAYQG